MWGCLSFMVLLVGLILLAPIISFIIVLGLIAFVIFFIMVTIGDMVYKA